MSSILLVLLFSLGPLAATLRAIDNESLPACCRTHGTHHCAMTDAAVERATDGNFGSTHFFSAPSHCPLYPAGAPARSSSSHPFAISVAGVLSTTGQNDLPVGDLAWPSSHLSHSVPVRGPPPPAVC